MIVQGNRHQLLVTLLLCNSLAMEALPLFLDRLLSPLLAVLISVTAILFVGEILPQALCTGKHQLAIAAVRGRSSEDGRTSESSALLRSLCGARYRVTPTCRVRTRFIVAQAPTLSIANSERPRDCVYIRKDR